MELMQKIMQMGFDGYFCSQILMKLALEYRGEENPSLVRSISAMNAGLGFTRSTCGAMLTACCVIGLYAGRGSDEEESSVDFNDMIREFLDWFRDEHSTTECSLIREANAGACHNLVAACHEKVFEILNEYGALD